MPAAGAPAAWITEDVRPIPKNIYGVTKVAAEGLCELFHRRDQLPCLILRTSRFFPEEDDDPAVRRAYDNRNVQANEFLYRRVELQDVVDAHLLALQKAPALGFGRYIISATSPFRPEDLPELPVRAPAVVQRRIPGYEAEYARRGWRMLPGIERVYVNARARRDLGWRPRYDFAHVIDCLQSGAGLPSPLARRSASKDTTGSGSRTGRTRYHDATGGESRGRLPRTMGERRLKQGTQAE
jgi:nucleoside-diphosphate-sugar epimerase